MSDDLDALISDLEKASNLTGADVRPTVAKGALNIKKATRRRWSGLSHAPRLASAVTYDTWLTRTGASAEIGPDKALEGRQGALGNLIEYGSVNNAPRPGLAPSLLEEEPRFAKALEDLGVKALPR